VESRQIYFGQTEQTLNLVDDRDRPGHDGGGELRPCL